MQNTNTGRWSRIVDTQAVGCSQAAHLTSARQANWAVYCSILKLGSTRTSGMDLALANACLWLRSLRCASLQNPLLVAVGNILQRRWIEVLQWYLAASKENRETSRPSMHECTGCMSAPNCTSDSNLHSVL